MVDPTEEPTRSTGSMALIALVMENWRFLMSPPREEPMMLPAEPIMTGARAPAMAPIGPGMMVLTRVPTNWPPAAPRAPPTTLPANSALATDFTAAPMEGFSPLMTWRARLVPTATVVVTARLVKEKLFFRDCLALAVPSEIPLLRRAEKVSACWTPVVWAVACWASSVSCADFLPD